MWSRWVTTCSTHRRTSARSCSAGSRGSASSASALLEQRVHQLVADRAQQLLLAAEVVVEAAGGEAERLRELGHRGLVVAALGEHARGAEHDLRAAAVVALAQGGPGGPCGHAAERTECSFELRMIIRYASAHGLRPLRRPRADPPHRPRLRRGRGEARRGGARPREALPVRDRGQARRARADGDPVPGGVRRRRGRLARLRARGRGAHARGLLGRDHDVRAHVARHAADLPVRLRGAEAAPDCPTCARARSSARSG